MSEEGAEVTVKIAESAKLIPTQETPIEPVTPQKKLVVEPEAGTVRAEIKVVALERGGIGGDNLKANEGTSEKMPQEGDGKEETDLVARNETALKAEISQTFRKVFQLTNKLLDMVEGALQRRIMLSEADELLDELEEQIRTLAEEIQSLSREFGSEAIPPLIGVQLKLQENMFRTIKTAHARAKNGREVEEIETEPDPLRQIQEDLVIVWQGGSPGIELHVRRQRQGEAGSGQLVSALRSEGKEGQKLVFTEIALTA